MTPTDQFPRDTAGLPAAAHRGRRPARRRPLRAAHRARRQAARRRDGADAGLQRLDPRPDAAGPRRARRSSVHVVNDGDLEATVHWHGLRLDNRYDGTHETQAPIPIGGGFTYRSRSPTPASTGTTRTSARTTARRWASTATSSSSPPTPTTGRRRTASSSLTLDDVLIEDGQIAAVQPRRDHLRGDGPLRQRAADRRRARPRADRAPGEVVRLYLTNTANTRVFNVALPGARMKLVGGDSGRVEHEEFVEDVLLAPSERAVVDVLLRRARRAGAGAPHARTGPTRSRTITVADERADAAAGRGVRRAAPRPELAAERERLAPLARRAAGQDPRLRRRDGLRRAASARARPSTPARCIRRSSARSRAAARSAA